MQFHLQNLSERDHHTLGEENIDSENRLNNENLDAN